MFKRRQSPTEPVRFQFEGREVIAQRGDTVAAALLAAGVQRFRDTPVSGAPRTPFCMIGNCFECLVEIDGAPNRQSCMIEVREAMQVREQHGLRSAEPDNVR